MYYPKMINLWRRSRFDYWFSSFLVSTITSVFSHKDTLMHSATAPIHLMSTFLGAPIVYNLINGMPRNCKMYL